MAEAAVSTIHGWCNRMLREHAFDSDSRFTQTLESDQSELLAEVVRDYWRTFMTPLDVQSVAEVWPWWPGPSTLQGNLRKLIEHAARLEPEREPAVALLAARKEKDKRLAQLKAPWATYVDELTVILNDAVAAKCVNGRKLQPSFYALARASIFALHLNDYTVTSTVEYKGMLVDGMKRQKTKDP